MAASDAALWQVAPPRAWPVAPQYMSFSTLTELEACPRRWALSAAAYPQVWDHQGYPQPALTATLEGTVTHVALETITRALSDRGCPSVEDASATVVLKDLGGITSVVGKSIARTLQRYASNPRAASALDRIQRHLTGRTADLRFRVQEFLSRTRLEPQPRNAPIPRGTDKKREYRGALPRGKSLRGAARSRGTPLAWRSGPAHPSRRRPVRFVTLRQESPKRSTNSNSTFTPSSGG